jgi:hypothetical protein
VGLLLFLSRTPALTSAQYWYVLLGRTTEVLLLLVNSLDSWMWTTRVPRFFWLWLEDSFIGTVTGSRVLMHLTGTNQTRLHPKKNRELKKLTPHWKFGKTEGFQNTALPTPFSVFISFTVLYAELGHWTNIWKSGISSHSCFFGICSCFSFPGLKLIALHRRRKGHFMPR